MMYSLCQTCHCLKSLRRCRRRLTHYPPWKLNSLQCAMPIWK